MEKLFQSLSALKQTYFPIKDPEDSAAAHGPETINNIPDQQVDPTSASLADTN